MSDTWDGVHAGDIVRGHDGKLYGVAAIERGHPAGVSITIRRNGEFSSMQVPAGVPIEITARADMSAEAVAWQVLQDAGFGPEIIGETYG